MIDRMDRVSAAIKREISVMLQEDVNDPRIRELTVTRVEVTRDLRLAKIYYTVFAGEKEKQEIKKGLRSAAGFLRRRLAGKISMKYIPELSFREDREKEREESIDRVFEKVEEELAAEEDKGESEEQGE